MGEISGHCQALNKKVFIYTCDAIVLQWLGYKMQILENLEKEVSSAVGSMCSI